MRSTGSPTPAAPSRARFFPPDRPAASASPCSSRSASCSTTKRTRTGSRAAGAIRSRGRAERASRPASAPTSPRQPRRKNSPLGRVRQPPARREHVRRRDRRQRQARRTRRTSRAPSEFTQAKAIATTAATRCEDRDRGARRHARRCARSIFGKLDRKRWPTRTRSPTRSSTTMPYYTIDDDASTTGSAGRSANQPYRAHTEWNTWYYEQY